MTTSDYHVARSSFIIAAAVLSLPFSARGGFTEYFNAVMASNPAAYWSFEDGDSGDVLNGATALDNSGNGHNGTYMAETTDGPQLVARPTFGGNAARFVRGGSSSEGDYILFDQLGDVGSSIDDNGVTFEFMFKNLQQDTAESRVFGVWNERPNSSADRRTQVTFSVNRPAGKQEVFLRDETGDVQEFEFDGTVRDINDGQWHHVAWVMLPGVVEDGHIVYIDGVAVPLSEISDTALSDVANFDKEFMIGGENISTRFSPNRRTFLVDALVDEFAVYSEALSASTIAAHASAAGLLVPEPCAATLVLLGVAIASTCARTRGEG